jgi:predicted transglutaminase-like cysteine proteinase
MRSGSSDSPEYPHTVPPTSERPGGILKLFKAYFSATRLGDLLVLEGKIHPDQLRGALLLAQAGKRRIGQVLIDQGLIRRRDLWATLGKQWGVRTLTWGVAAFMSIGTIAPRSSRADDRGYTTNTTLTLTSSMGLPDRPRDLQPLSSYPALFGSGEKVSRDLSAFTKWTSMFSRYNSERDMSGYRATFASWRKHINDFSGEDIADMARDVDTYVNQVTYIEDRANWSKSDYWATPVEFFKNGGDCEDFAIAKYMSLRALGVPEERLRLAIVYDRIKEIPHAVLVVYTNDGALVLDNQSKVMRRADEISRYKPIFSINRQAWWLHTDGGDINVASAAQ